MTLSVSQFANDGRESNSLTFRPFSHWAVTRTGKAAYAVGYGDVSNQGFCSSRELRVGGSRPPGRTIHDSNCLRSRENAESPPLVVSSAFRHRAITSNDSGPSAIAPHAYREQGKQFRERAIRIPPAAPNPRVGPTGLTEQCPTGNDARRTYT